MVERTGSLDSPPEFLLALAKLIISPSSRHCRLSLSLSVSADPHTNSIFYRGSPLVWNGTCLLPHTKIHILTSTRDLLRTKYVSFVMIG